MARLIGHGDIKNTEDGNNLEYMSFRAWLQKSLVFDDDHIRRNWLIALNCITLLLSCGQVLLALEFITVFFGSSGSTGVQGDQMLLNWLILCVIGLCDALVAICGICAAKRVSRDLLIVFFSAAVFIIAPSILFTSFSFEFQLVESCFLFD
jgi:hypothetical protein